MATEIIPREKTLPHNAEAERTVLGAVLVDGSTFNSAAEILTRDDFYREAHRRIFDAMLGLALSAPGYTRGDIHDWAQGQMLSAERLVPETSALPAKALGGEFAVPVFVIQGAEDFTTPTSLARDFVRSIRAPRKEFVAIPGGGHFAVFMKPDLFLREMAARVLPIAGRDP